MQRILVFPKGKGLYLEHLITYKDHGEKKTVYTKKKYRNGQMLRIWIGENRIYTEKEIHESLFAVLLMLIISSIVTAVLL